MAAQNEAIPNSAKIRSDDTLKDELEKILNNVVHKRKTVPSKCMQLHKNTVHYEVKQLQNARVKLEETEEKQAFMKLVHKLKNLEHMHISLDDLHQAENRLNKCHKNLKDINDYLKNRREYIK